VSSSATYGSPAWEVLAAAERFHPELIVVGSHGHSALSRFFLGSISQRVLTEAHCSVRVSRGRIEVDESPVRIIIGFDGSAGSRAAVSAVAGRHWQPGSEIRLVTATELITPSSITRFVPPVVRMVEEVNVTEEHWISDLAAASIAKLDLAGLAAKHHIHPGNPKDILVEEAQSWGADCIFVGANAYGSRLERALIGSTSAAVAARAHCSVEVVRATAAVNGLKDP
jgi:nucleotide-binding universal stress UspA family protein